MSPIDRRRFLGLGIGLGIGLGSGALALPGAGEGATRHPPRPRAARPERVGEPAADGDRLLVVVEMLGGNDGLSMIVPYTDPLYAQLRPRTAIGADAVLPIDGQVAFNPGLRNVAAARPAVIAGVGVAQPNLSHFEMQRRWWTADPDGTLGPTTGWLGRLCDAVGDPDAPAVGITVGPAPSVVLDANRVVTLSVDPTEGVAFPVPGQPSSPYAAPWLDGQGAMALARRSDSPILATARGGTRAALRFSSEAARVLPPAGAGYPEGETAGQFQMAARLLDTGMGVRVVHIPLQDDYDTHEGLPGRYPKLMADLDASIGPFLADLAARGLSDRVLVMTTSEFGRRVPDNASDGLDHGAASFTLAFGPVTPGVHGTVPSLAGLDPYGNLVASVGMTEYMAVAVEGWFGVPSGEVLHGSPAPLPGVLT